MVDRLKSGWRFVFDLLVASGQTYGMERVSRMSAAVAYRMLFAMTPLFIISVGALALFVDTNEAAQEVIFDFIAQLVGQEVAESFERLLGTAFFDTSFGLIIGIGLLLWTTSNLFYEVQNDLNDIFQVPYEQTTGPIEFVRKRGLGFLWGIGIGVLVLIVWLLNVLWGAFESFFEDVGLGVLHTIVSAVTPLVSAVVLPVLFALLYQSLTAVKIGRRALIYGSVLTSIGFVVAAWGTGVYFAFDENSTATSLAGSLFVIILAVYILASVFLFGGVVMKVGDDYLSKGGLLSPHEREVEERRSALAEQTEVVVSQPERPLPLAAFVAFLAGLFVGWRRSRR